MALTPKKTETLNGVKVNHFYVNEDNPYNVAMPTVKFSEIIGVTIHNTNSITVASGTTEAEQYTRATRNGHMGTVVVHFYIDEYCAWQNLPLTLSSWHAGDGSGNGNRKTISIEIIGPSQKAEDNGAKIAGYLLAKYNLPIERLYRHKDWNGKNCPEYILPHWDSFKEKVKTEMAKCKGTNAAGTTAIVYKVRDSKGNILGSYANIDNAKANCSEGCQVIDNSGKVVYTTATATTTATTPVNNGEKINVKYRVYAAGGWLPEVINCEDISENGYAGIERYPIKRLAAQSDKGTLSYRVHLRNGGWLNWISQYDINNSKTGYAGLSQVDLDAIQIKLDDLPGYTVRYRVSNTGTSSYYPWVIGLEDYAGVFGKSIDKVQIEIIKV